MKTMRKEDLIKRFNEIRNTEIALAKNKRKPGALRAIGISGSARSENDMAAEDSNSEFLLQVALDKLKSEGVKTEMIALRNYDIKYCKACYSTTNNQCHFPCSCYQRDTPIADDMSNLLYDKIIDADIIIFATPVNNFKISTLMATFLDRCISLDGSLPPADELARKNKEINIEHTKFVSKMADQKIPGSGFVRRFSGKVAGIIVTGHEEGAGMVISSLFMALNHFGMIFPPWSNVYAMSSITKPTYEDKKIVEAEVHQNNVRIMIDNILTMAKQVKEIHWMYDYSSN